MTIDQGAKGLCVPGGGLLNQGNITRFRIASLHARRLRRHLVRRGQYTFTFHRLSCARSEVSSRKYGFLYLSCDSAEFPPFWVDGIRDGRGLASGIQMQFVQILTVKYELRVLAAKQAKRSAILAEEVGCRPYHWMRLSRSAPLGRFPFLSATCAFTWA